MVKDGKTDQRRFSTNFLTSPYVDGITRHSESTHIDCRHLDFLRLQLITPATPLYTASAEEAALMAPFPDPFWGFCWPGSYALCRFLLANPDVVRGKLVLDFAAGCGIASIVALHVGASASIANDIDSWACTASLINAAANLPASTLATSFHVYDGNLVGAPLSSVHDATMSAAHPQLTSSSSSPPSDWVVLAGDVCYEEPLATDVIAWLHALAAQGVHVLLGDPGRQFLPHARLHPVASYELPPSIADGNFGLSPSGAVWTLLPTSHLHKQK
ncbi:hypothetical protein DYB37_001869 [Aphanomyces astaci]|uniref:ETFB lysine methyltransferase n=1 Tax=Aphanomyces astaci TaxID=112090 RepID=A0A418CUL8_APHAT|nr:hypothetical protein DYB35_002472 [Aphanomyces astaci]RHZ03537.1 hypothetical protein DYB37_001869 [Aphanomyces astaci]